MEREGEEGGGWEGKGRVREGRGMGERWGGGGIGREWRSVGEGEEEEGKG